MFGFPVVFGYGVSVLSFSGRQGSGVLARLLGIIRPIGFGVSVIAVAVGVGVSANGYGAAGFRRLFVRGFGVALLLL
jgi:hypothetical protein